MMLVVVGVGGCDGGSGGKDDGEDIGHSMVVMMDNGDDSGHSMVALLDVGDDSGHSIVVIMDNGDDSGHCRVVMMDNGDDNITHNVRHFFLHLDILYSRAKLIGDLVCLEIAKDSFPSKEVKCSKAVLLCFINHVH